MNHSPIFMLTQHHPNFSLFPLFPNSNMYNLNTTTALSLALLLALSLVSVLHFFQFHNVSLSKTHLHLQSHLQVAHTTCLGTLYPQLCLSTLSSLPDLPSKSVQQIISSVISHAVSEVKSSSHSCHGLRNNLTNLDPLEQRALDDCLKLFDDTVYELDATVADLSGFEIGFKRYRDLQTLLSGAMTNLYTCLDGFAYSPGNVRDRIQDRLFEISRRVSNSLAMLKNVPGLKKASDSEIFPEYGSVKNGFPSWLYSRERNLLEANVNETRFDLVVAKDGTGNFTTIGEAVNAAPNSSTSRIVIHIKAGAYFENVEVIRKKTNLMFVGDGIGKTIVKASRNVVDGWTTFQSATVAVAGTGFIAKGVTFENSAGAGKHQAVALRNSADLSAFYKCSFVGYQDTLYVHSLRQFYRDCDVYGTVDFIFGNAAALFQNCNLYARKPLLSQKNMLTAQGRDDPNQNTGISILNCKVAPAEDLIPVKSSFKTYLGRPWKPYSRTVYLRSYMEDLIEPAGWLEWNRTLGLDTLYYREYVNTGPGSNTSARVRWPGFRVINSSTEASQFTAARFIQGYDWLNSTAIPFYLDLS